VPPARRNDNAAAIRIKRRLENPPHGLQVIGSGP
jgi:hypothetical protein